MKITEIEEVSKARVRVIPEEGSAFVLYRGELRSFRIRVGEELEEGDYRSIMEEILPRRAKLRAMNLLKSRAYTVRQLRDKLKAGGYPEEIIEDALAYVDSYHYTDDCSYALSFIRCYADKRSRRRLEQDLLGRGADRETLEKAWREWEEEGGEQDEQAMIRTLLEKKGFDPESADRKERGRMYAFLCRRGFSGDQVRKAVLSEGYWE